MMIPSRNSRLQDLKGLEGSRSEARVRGRIFASSSSHRRPHLGTRSGRYLPKLWYNARPTPRYHLCGDRLLAVSTILIQSMCTHGQDQASGPLEPSGGTYHGVDGARGFSWCSGPEVAAGDEKGEGLSHHSDIKNKLIVSLDYQDGVSLRPRHQATALRGSWTGRTG